MSAVSHSARVRSARSGGRGPQTRGRTLAVRALIERGARRLQRAGVFFGHGTDNAWDESATLVLHALGLSQTDAAVYARRIGPAAQQRVEALLTRRIRERIPAVYLTGQTWFAGLAFQVDRRVLIPRSPIAELIERRFAPWIDPRSVRRVLDVGTGSGCIAIACARTFPRARGNALAQAMPMQPDPVPTSSTRRTRRGSTQGANRRSMSSAIGERGISTRGST